MPAGGAAADMAATMGDNLKGDLAILESGAQDMAIALSDWLMPARAAWRRALPT